MKSYSEVIARNLRVARAGIDLTQAAVAERMRNLGFASWRRSTVSLTEQGQRRVTAEELLGLAFALGTSMTRLIKADHDDGYIEFPGGVGIHADSAAASAQGFNDGAIGWDGSTPVRNPRRRATYPDGSSGLAWHDWYEPPEPVITR